MGLKNLFAAHADNEAVTHEIEVKGMHCHGCEQLVKAELEERGASNVVAHHETGVVTYQGDLADDAVASAIAEAGFELA